jgi:sugar phosphate isomerase/epimerase
MPWVHPDSAESYRDLVAAIDRDRFGVHLDPVNLINGPRRYFDTGAVIRNCVDLLGPHIRSCHAKDISLSGRLTVHLDEARPGTGGLDYRAFLRAIDRLDPDMPLMLEHLESEAEYRLAAGHIRSVAASLGLSIR